MGKASSGVQDLFSEHSVSAPLDYIRALLIPQVISTALLFTWKEKKKKKKKHLWQREPCSKPVLSTSQYK